MTSYRPKKVGEEIRRVLSEKLLRGLRDPLPGFVTIREVEVNRDFTRAKVFFSVIGTDSDKQGAQAVLEGARGLLRAEVGKKVRLRNTPDLVFIQDESGERAARIHQLLGEVVPVTATAVPAAASDDDDDGEDEAEGDEEE
ncbi:MAG: 30S ribosome-binding factor RbfA [Myxococcota bacterium]